MRCCVSVGAVLVVGAIAGAGVAAPSPKSELADTKDNVPSVDIELVIAVDVSYSMDLDELAVQREGYAQAIVFQGIPPGAQDGPEKQVGRDLFRVVGIE